MFKVLDFTYAGKSSTDIGLKIVTFDSGGMLTDNVGVSLEIEEEKIKRIDKPFFYGVEATPKLQFKLQLAYLPKDNATTYITPQTMGAIGKWLYKRQYYEFKIIDTDFTNITYNCIFQNPKQIQIGNFPYAVEVDVICDRPYGIYNKTISKSITNNSTFFIKNEGFNNDFIYPKIQFTLGSTATAISIQNLTDTGRTALIFTGLTPNETINVDCRTQQIVSSTGLNRNTNCNYSWFRLTQNYDNQVSISGTSSVSFAFEFPMLV